MNKRYVLQVLNNENETVDAIKNQFVKLLDKHKNIDFTIFSKFEHVDDVFGATFFKTKEQAKKEVKKNGPWGVDYYIAEIELKLS